MKIKYIDKIEDKVIHFEEDDFDLTEKDADHIAEIFQTPLTGAYAWDYRAADKKIRRLYRLGKLLNWNAEIDVDWTQEYPMTESPMPPELNPFIGYEPFESMSEEEQLLFGWHNLNWTLSQFLHGEQGALLIASQLVSCAPTTDAKLYAASQTFDEARHVEVFNKYITEKLNFMYPVDPHLKMLLDKILTDSRWDLKFIGMQIIIEGLALSAFHTTEATLLVPLLKDILRYVIRDEARHVAFGVIFLEDYVKSLSEEEIEERAQFAYEACVVMKERLIPNRIFEEFGWPVEASRKLFIEASFMEMFRNLLFNRIVPNLKKIGLLTDRVRPKYEELGVLQFEDMTHDGEIDWAILDKDLGKDGSSEVA